MSPKLISHNRCNRELPHSEYFYRVLLRMTNPSLAFLCTNKKCFSRGRSSVFNIARERVSLLFSFLFFFVLNDPHDYGAICIHSQRKSEFYTIGYWGKFSQKVSNHKKKKIAPKNHHTQTLAE